MKKKLALSLCALSLLATGALFATGNNTQAVQAAEPAAEREFNGRDFLTWFYEDAHWRTLQNKNPNTGHPGGFVRDESGRPSDEDLELILNTASLAVTSGGRTDWYMVVVKDTDAQNEIIGKIEGVSRATSDGTVTVLIFSERLIRTDYRTDEVVGFAPDRGYYNVGILTGYLNMASVAMGYGTRMFMTPNIPGNGFREGQRWLEAEHFLDGRYYVLGTTGEAFSTENMKFVNAVVIGTPAELEYDTDVFTGATTNSFPRNWSVWDPAYATGPIIPEVVEAPAAAPAPVATPANVFTNGVHTGTAYGFFHRPLTVSVTVANGVITSVEVTEHGETPEYFMQAAQGTSTVTGVIPQIESTNSLDVDVVAGATGTSYAILNAVADALGVER